MPALRRTRSRLASNDLVTSPTTGGIALGSSVSRAIVGASAPMASVAPTAPHTGQVIAAGLSSAAVGDQTCCCGHLARRAMRTLGLREELKLCRLSRGGEFVARSGEFNHGDTEARSRQLTTDAHR